MEDKIKEDKTKDESQVRTFVKYTNRKMHEVGHRSSYVNMADLLSIVAEGTSVQIIEDATGKDLTAYTFARLLFDRCRMDKNAYKAGDLQKLIMTNPPPPPKKKKAA